MSKTVKNVNQIRMKLIVAHSNSEKEETQTFWGYNKKKKQKETYQIKHALLRALATTLK